MPTVTAVMPRESMRKVDLTKRDVFVAGAIGAFAPQILRWYTQVDLDLAWDTWFLAGRAALILLFLGLAGYVTVLWEVRNLKEAFLIGLAVPSIILGPGTDLASLAKPRGAGAEPASVAGKLVVEAKSDDGAPLGQVRVEATDGSSRRYSSDRGQLFLPAGRYQVAVRASGHEPDERGVVIEPHEVKQISVTLRRLSASERFLRGLTVPFEHRQR